MTPMPKSGTDTRTHSGRTRDLLSAMFAAAIESAQPSRCMPAHLPTPHSLGRGRLIVIGAGKASAAMARAVEDHWTGDAAQRGGLVVTRYGYAVPCQRIEIVEAAHPVPDTAGLGAVPYTHLRAHETGLELVCRLLLAKNKKKKKLSRSRQFHPLSMHWLEMHPVFLQPALL